MAASLTERPRGPTKARTSFTARGFSLPLVTLSLGLAACSGTSDGTASPPVAPGDPNVAQARSEKPRDTKPNVAAIDIQQLTGDGRDFAMRMFAELRTDKAVVGKNVFFSPHSIYTAFGMLHAGAEGSTEAAMAKGLSYSLPQDRLGLPSDIKLVLVNAVHFGRRSSLDRALARNVTAWIVAVRPVVKRSVHNVLLARARLTTLAALEATWAPLIRLFALLVVPNILSLQLFALTASKAIGRTARGGRRTRSSERGRCGAFRL